MAAEAIGMQRGYVPSLSIANSGGGRVSKVDCRPGIPMTKGPNMYSRDYYRDKHARSRGNAKSLLKFTL